MKLIKEKMNFLLKNQKYFKLLLKKSNLIENVINHPGLGQEFSGFKLKGCRQLVSDHAEISSKIPTNVLSLEKTYKILE